MQPDAELYSEILDIFEPFQVSSDSISRLWLSYCEPWRTYHNSSHILQMLRLSRRPGIILEDDARQRLELMIVYHDVWYKVGRPAGENEEESAKWAYGDIDSENTSEAVIGLRRAVRQGIRATAKHSLDNINPKYVEEIGTLLDLDLWGLGQTPDRFKEDTEKVWGEFQPIATRGEFDKGRSVWARGFLENRNGIYHTEPFLHLEDMAKYNLEQLANQQQGDH